MLKSPSLLFTVAALLAMPCTSVSAQQDDASDATRAVFADVARNKAWDDTQDFANATRGLVARPDYPRILADNGATVWVFKDFEAMRGQSAPPTVNPVLWRQAQLNASTGLFKVTDDIYQVRGFDLANMTVVEGQTGIIIIDPLTSIESARAALAMYYAHRPQRPVVAVIYTHSHMDHFGGVKGVITEQDVRDGKVQVIAPLDFEQEAISENVFAGNAMLRRTVFYSGIPLPKNAFGTVDAGLGPGVANGRRSFIAPTLEIRRAVENRTIDGVEIEFRLANNTEAPSEMVMYFPRQHVLDVAEVAVHTVHNVLTPRGARVRDALTWSRVLDTMAAEYGDVAEIMIGQHHWPTWGREAIVAHLEHQRDFYKLAHDQALNLANQGYDMDEIAAALELPRGLADVWTIQDFYGTLGSAGKAVFQAYLGWYNGNPAHLNPLPENESARLYVDYMGGAGALLARAQRDFDAGHYRWVVEVLNHLVMAEPGNTAARELSASAFQQLGYQQVSATWRNLFLMAAFELRNGIVAPPVSASGDDFTRSMSVENILTYAGIALSSPQIGGRTLAMNLELTDVGREFGIEVQNAVLSYREQPVAGATFTLRTDKATLADLFAKRVSWTDAVARGLASGTGNADDFVSVLNAMTAFKPDFGLVTP
ncbi:MAG: MBL fold metallo-hydrolase [Gammaproteobacteria bacterium]|nr:MBL fold metallo-hydrolase [Gammaproteobacteria bacterium]